MAKDFVRLSEVTVLHLDAGNDKNGNPRRVFVLVHPIRGKLAAVDEGYSGIDALKQIGDGTPGVSFAKALQARITARIPTTAKYYREMIKRSPVTSVELVS